MIDLPSEIPWEELNEYPADKVNFVGPLNIGMMHEVMLFLGVIENNLLLLLLTQSILLD